MARPPRKAGKKGAGRAPRRPAAISPAQWRGLSATTKRRYAGYLERHPGATLTEARGHRPGEAARRRQRVEDAIENMAERQAFRWRGTDAGDFADALRQLVRDRGEGVLTELQRELDRARARYVANKHVALRDGTMERLADLFGLPKEMLGYH